MKKWYLIGDIYILFFLAVIITIPYFENSWIVVPVISILSVLFIVLFIKTASLEMKREDFSQRNEDYYISNDKLVKCYVSNFTVNFGFILFLCSVGLLIGVGMFKWKLEFNLLIKALLALWAFFFIFIGSRNHYYKKVILNKIKSS